MTRKTKIKKGILVMFILCGLNSLANQNQQRTGGKKVDGYKAADRELNSVYNKILNEYAGKQEFVKKLRIAQRAWIVLRDAEVEARFPEPDRYGSAISSCESIYKEKLTRDRIKFLKIWLVGIPEGDVCNGSVKRKQ